MSKLQKNFYKGQWGGNESLSGAGSSLKYTENLRSELQTILRSSKVKTFLDAPCGDFNWMRHVDLTGIHYIGMDIVADIVSDLEKNFGSKQRKFMWGDITVAELPKADLMLCRDCLFHLPWCYGLKFLENFVKSGIPHLLLTSHLGKHRDIDQPGRWRQLNMRLAPFNLPEPIKAIDDWIEGHPKRYVGLWSTDQIRNALAK